MFGKSKNSPSEGVNQVKFRGEDWYEARNDHSRQVFRTAAEAAERSSLIDAYRKASSDR